MDHDSYSKFIESRTTNWGAHTEVALKTHLPKKKKKQTKKTPTSMEKEKWQPRHVSEGCRKSPCSLSWEPHSLQLIRVTRTLEP